MHFFLILALSLPAFAASNQDISYAKKTIQTLLLPIMAKTGQKPSHDFRIDQCEKYKIKIEDLLLSQKKMVIDYKFKDGCDLQGSISPKIMQEFPIKLDIRHAADFHQILSTNKITADLDFRPTMILESRSGLLKSKKGDVEFELDYRIKINAMAEGEDKHEDLGGEIRINKIFGEKVSIKEKIKIKQN